MTDAQDTSRRVAGLEALAREIVTCRRCPRLVAWREEIARRKRAAFAASEYWGKPVPGFGDPQARILVVGLAPGAHGSNRTGRQFTGDASGDFLFRALHRAGFASQPRATHRNDGLMLSGLYITASARCVPPGNKPLPSELDNCEDYLRRERELLEPRVIVCLGRVAFDRVRKMLGQGDLPAGWTSRRLRSLRFRHGATFHLGERLWLVCSYHPSQQNTQTGRLSKRMFAAVWRKARRLGDST